MGPAKKKRASSAKKVMRGIRPKEKGNKRPEIGVPNVAVPLLLEKSSRGAYLLLGALALTVVGFYSLPNYHLLLPPDSFLARLLTHPSLLFLGFAGLVAAFHYLPKETDRSEMPRWLAYLWFAFFFGLCFFSRFYRPEESSPFFWADNLITTGDIRNIIDFKQRPLLFPISSRPPFFSYFTAALWEIFPKASGVWITRLSCTLMDLGVIWGLYRLGSAIRGRRMGLIMMAFEALSRAGMIWPYYGCGINSTVLACVWALFFFYRVIQKPTLKHFAFWGIALAFGDYCYPMSRPWTPTMISIVLIWVLFGSKEKVKGVWPWVLAAGLWLSWAILFFYKNNFLPLSSGAAFIVSPWFLGAVAVILVAVYIKTWIGAKESEANRKVFGWATGAGLTALLMSPLLLHPLYSSYSTTISIFHENGKLILGLATLKLLWFKIVFTLGAVFTATDLTETTHCLGHSFFESFSELAMVVGLAYFLSRPSGRKSFVLLIALVGMVPFILSNQDHTGRLLGAVAPLYLLGGWGLDAFWELFSLKAKSDILRKVAFLLLLSLWAWDAKWSFDLCQKWMTTQTKNDPIIGSQVNKDWKQYKVILAQQLPDFVGPAFPMLCDQKDAWRLNDPNPIYLEPGQKEKDIILLVYGGDKATQERVRKEFPQAEWTGVPSLNGPNFMERVLIPFASLDEVPGKILYVQRVPHEYWRRRFYMAYGSYGIARGMIWWDDRVPTVQDHIPSFVNESVTAQVDGQLTVPTDGEYNFLISQAKDVIILLIDGKQRMHLWSGLSAKENIYLKAGVHQVTLKTAFRHTFTFTDVLVTPPAGSGGQWVLGQPPVESKHQ